MSKQEEEIDKMKKQISDRDRQISGLAAQLKSAGVKPDFKRANSKERGRPESPKGKKGDGKGKKDKEKVLHTLHTRV